MGRAGAAQALITIALVVWLALQLDRSVFDAVAELDPGTLLLATVIMASAQLWGGLRLAAILRGSPLNAAQAVAATFVGYFFANFLPGTVGGDLVRAVRLKAAGVRLSESAGALVLDRVLNTLAMVLVASLAAGPLVTKITASLDSGKIIAVIVAGLMAATAVVAFAAHNRRVRTLLIESAEPSVNLMTSPATLLFVAIMTLASIGSSIVAQWLLAQHMGIPVSLIELAGLACAIALIGIIPVSLNGIGVQEASYVAGLTLLGAHKPAAVAFAIIIRLVILASSLIGGAVFIAEKITAVRSRPS